MADLSMLLQCVILHVCLWLGLVAAKLDQTPLQPDAYQDRTQTFSPRFVFHDDLKDLDNLSAEFVNIPATHYVKSPGVSQKSSTAKPIKFGHSYARMADRNLISRPGMITATVPIPIPEVTDKDTIINLAKMTSDVYYFNSSDSSWLNLTQGFKDDLHFGYGKDGLQGHIFANRDNSTIIVAFKGSSVTPFERTRTKDQLNDNLLFSCCCASQRPDPYWYGQVCSCREEVFKCNSTCLTSEILRQDRYYAAAKSIMYNVARDMFPSAAILTTGHSLGGSLASLMGLTFDVPAITFEAPPDRLPARRLGLVPLNTEDDPPLAPTFHFGNTADPIYMGACTGFFSTCGAAGYSFESQCFTGKRCVYDTMGDKGWSSTILNHPISTVIEDVLKVYDDVPTCIDEDDDCADCFNWIFD